MTGFEPRTFGVLVPEATTQLSEYF